jgi:transposase-like protein
MITDIIKMIDDIVDESNKEYNNNPILNINLNKIFTKLEEMNAIMHVISDELDTEKNQNKKILLEIEKLKLELEILKEKNKLVPNETKTCIDCNKTLTTKFATRCGSCERKDRLKVSMESKEKPSYVQLKKDVEDLRFVSHVAKKYNVSNNCITRWLSNYEKINQTHVEETVENKNNIIISKTKETKIDKDKPNEDKPKIDKDKSKIKKDKPKQEVIKQDKKCSDCNIPIYYKSTRCKKCLNMQKIKDGVLNAGRPSLDQLNKDIKELGSMVKVGHKYGVSDNAVRKWIKRYSQVEI